jgi:hypothetical protein
LSTSFRILPASISRVLSTLSRILKIITTAISARGHILLATISPVLSTSFLILAAIISRVLSILRRILKTTVPIISAHDHILSALSNYSRGFEQFIWSWYK